MARARKAKAADVEAICRALPAVELGVTWHDQPSFVVPTSSAGKGKGRAFVIYRRPHKTAVDPATGQPYDDLLVIRTATAEDKAELVEDPGTPFFTVEHFNRSNAVLVQQSRLGELSYDELRQIITDAWRAVAPARLVREFDALS